MNTNRNFSGMVLVFLYSLTSALSFVVVSRYEQNFDPLKLTMYNFLIAMLFFVCITLPKSSQIKKQVMQNKALFLMVNITTVLAWLPIFYGLKYVEPAVATGICFGVVPIASILFSLLNNGLKSITKQDIIFASLIACVIGLIIAYYIYRLPHKSFTEDYYTYLSLLLLIVSGIGTAWVVSNMKSLSIEGFSAIQVMAIRFYLITLLTAILVWHFNIGFTLTLRGFFEIAIIALLTIILPLFLIQKGIERTDPVNVGFIMPLQPLMTYGIQILEGRFHHSAGILILLLLLSSIIIISAWFKIRRAYKSNA